jgi:hypothetical protein
LALYSETASADQEILAETSLISSRWHTMSEQPTITELAHVLLRQLYEASEAGSRQLRVVATSRAAKAALEFAVDNDWVIVEEDRDVSLTDTGLAVVRKGFS